jgi:hypothetical protein
MRKLFNAGFLQKKYNALYVEHLFLTLLQQKKIFYQKKLFFINNLDYSQKIYKKQDDVSIMDFVTQRNAEAESVAVFFFKMLINSKFEQNSQNNILPTYAKNNIFYKILPTCEIFSFKPVNYINMVKNTYLLFFNAGLAGANFLVLGSEQLYVDWSAINYANLITAGNRKLLKFYMQECCIEDNVGSMFKTDFLDNFDFLFILDSRIKIKKFLGYKAVTPFLIGVTNDSHGLSDFDMLLPFDTVTISIQYYFLEFFASAISSGYGRYMFLRRCAISKTQQKLLSFYL